MLKRVGRLFRGDESKSKSKPVPSRTVAAPHTTAARTAYVAQPQAAYGVIHTYEVKKLPRTPEELNGYVMSQPHLNALIKSLKGNGSTAKVLQACDDVKKLHKHETMEPGSYLSAMEIKELRCEITNLLSDVYNLENNHRPAASGQKTIHDLSTNEIRETLSDIAEIDRLIAEQLKERYQSNEPSASISNQNANYQVAYESFPLTTEEFAHYVHNEGALVQLINKCKYPNSVENLLVAKDFFIELHSLNLKPYDAYTLKSKIALNLEIVKHVEKF